MTDVSAIMLRRPLEWGRENKSCRPVDYVLSEAFTSAKSGCKAAWFHPRTRESCSRKLKK
ncbi:hypothetical protein N7471_010485 [Penicillium samsonianum]|uniref:uncharacterized protein n=1 Tax=Penicillium samsonianum TaxID=1882272 RepID=UPI002547A28F|nr:uncharacterized protein N7471_010485 [Penicillium samsonianum]KAJ6125992.1 hypothetical protein N7471_010485 [Penicillium samsonianum]